MAATERRSFRRGGLDETAALAAEEDRAGELLVTLQNLAMAALAAAADTMQILLTQVLPHRGAEVLAAAVRDGAEAVLALQVHPYLEVEAGEMMQVR